MDIPPSLAHYLAHLAVKRQRGLLQETCFNTSHDGRHELLMGSIWGQEPVQLHSNLKIKKRIRSIKEK